MCKKAGFCSIRAFCEAHNLSDSTVYGWTQRGVPRWIIWYLDERRKRLYYEQKFNTMKELFYAEEEKDQKEI